MGSLLARAAACGRRRRRSTPSTPRRRRRRACGSAPRSGPRRDAHARRPPQGAGPFPLVVFVHGAGAPPQLYAPCSRARRRERRRGPRDARQRGPPDRRAPTLPYQPGRMRQVLDAVTRPGPQAIRAADPERVVVMGHNLGGMAVLATGSTGAASTGGSTPWSPCPGGWRRSPAAPTPAAPSRLLVHGAGDDVVPFGGSGGPSRSSVPPRTCCPSRAGTTRLPRADDAATRGSGRDPRLPPATVGGDPRAAWPISPRGPLPGVRLTTRG